MRLDNCLAVSLGARLLPAAGSWLLAIEASISALTVNR